MNELITIIDTMDALKSVNAKSITCALPSHLEHWVIDEWEKCEGDVLSFWCKLDNDNRKLFGHMIQAIIDFNKEQ